MSSTSMYLLTACNFAQIYESPMLNELQTFCPSHADSHQRLNISGDIYLIEGLTGPISCLDSHGTIQSIV